jgi:hypothetical protein
MNNSFPRLLDGVVAILRTEVLSRLEDSFARGQVFGAIYILNHLKARGDWSVKYLSEQLAAQRAMFERVTEIAGDRAAQLPASPSFPERTYAAAELEQIREQGNRTIATMLDWLSAQHDSLDAESRKAMETAIRACMRREIEIEMAHTAAPMFAEISQG